MTFNGFTFGLTQDHRTQPYIVAHNERGSEAACDLLSHCNRSSLGWGRVFDADDAALEEIPFLSRAPPNYCF